MKMLYIQLLGMIFIISFIKVEAQITTAQSGNWSETSTWVGGNLPTSSNDIIIGAGHILTVNTTDAVCNSISFGDANAKIYLDTLSVLSVYGNINLVSTSHAAFSYWASGSKLKFAGVADQLLNGWTTSTTATATSLMEVVIDKDSGKVYTPGTDVKITIGTSLDIISGTFELGSTDDIQGRNLAWGATSPTITVYENGVFDMLGGASHIRRASNTGDDTKKIGKLTIAGDVYLATSSTIFLNFSDIDIEAGGRLFIPLNRGWTANKLNPGTVTVKKDGRIVNSLVTDVWYANTITPTQLILEEEGVFETTSSTTPFPINFFNNGTVLYSRNITESDQTITDMDYHRIVLSRSNTDSKKLWTLSDNRAVYDSLETNNSAQLILTASTPQTLTVKGTLRLTSGSVDNSNSNISLLMDSVSVISRATGIITNTPTYIYGNTIRYTSTNQVTTGAELPASIPNLVFLGSGGVILGSNTTVSENLTLSVGEFDNNGASDDKQLIIGNNANIRRATGTLTSTPLLSGIMNLEYISTVAHVTTGFEVTPDVTSLNNVTVTGNQGVTLGSDLHVNGNLTLTGSGIETDTFKIFLKSNGELNETGGKVNGSISAVRTAQTGVNQTFGNIGFEVNAAGNAPGVTSVERVTGFAFSGNGNETIKRYFIVTPQVNNSLNATIVFHYDTEDLNGINESKLVALRSTDNGVNWVDITGTVDLINNNITVTGINQMSWWTLANQDSIIPVELISFNAKSNNNEVQLEWITATETNNKGFEIERKNGEEWNSIAFIEGKGTTTENQQYRYVDNVNSAGKYSYRLKQIDYDGSFHYSNVVEVEAGFIPKVFVLEQNYPNPFNPMTTIEFTLAEDGKTELKVYNIIGKEITTLFKEEGKSGQIYKINFNADELPSGIYFAKLTQGSNQTVRKMVLIK
jgi:hypothetical protein